MWSGRRRADRFFTRLCEDYYEKVLRYLCFALGDTEAARDTVQEVFLTACGKRELLEQHPNPGGFLLQTAKNLAGKSRREAFRRVTREALSDDGEPPDSPDADSLIETRLDRAVDEHHYIEDVLSQLSDEKRKLYTLYYLRGKSMAEIAGLYHLEEAAVRMRYVRLRREIRSIAAQVAEEKFPV